MRPISSLVARLQADFPDIIFAAGDTFHWSPEKNTVAYEADSTDLPALLHELSHALLGHSDYRRDIELLRIEQEAWQYAASTLSSKYGVAITTEDIENSLDTYRDWLHARSTCPDCGATGLQEKQQAYRCIACGRKWRANDARACALRRYKIK